MLQKKEKAAPPKESVDEIDEIMSEIEELQQSMSSAQSGSQAKTSPRAEEPNVMEDFHAGGSDVSIEETLGDLKDDEPSGPNLIDQAMAEEAAREAGTENEGQGSDLLEAEEAEALDEAVAEAEAAIRDDFESDELEEEASVSKKGNVIVRLAGDMTLKLSYEFEGQEVTIGFTDGSLRVELSDGTEFKIPVRRPVKKVA